MEDTMFMILHIILIDMATQLTELNTMVLAADMEQDIMAIMVPMEQDIMVIMVPMEQDIMAIRVHMEQDIMVTLKDIAMPVITNTQTVAHVTLLVDIVPLVELDVDTQQEIMQVDMELVTEMEILQFIEVIMMDILLLITTIIIIILELEVVDMYILQQPDTEVKRITNLSKFYMLCLKEAEF